MLIILKGEASKSKLVGKAMLGKYGESCRARRDEPPRIVDSCKCPDREQCGL
jgi:hypothetical protein